jgi:hypothetical protein
LNILAKAAYLLLTNSKKTLIYCYTEEVYQNFMELISVLKLFIGKNITQTTMLSHLNNNIINNIGSNKLCWQENVEGNLALTGVNFINILCAHFLYENLFSAKSLALNKISYEKCANKMLMKLISG